MQFIRRALYCMYIARDDLDVCYWVLVCLGKGSSITERKTRGQGREGQCATRRRDPKTHTATVSIHVRVRVRVRCCLISLPTCGKRTLIKGCPKPPITSLRTFLSFSHSSFVSSRAHIVVKVKSNSRLLLQWHVMEHKGPSGQINGQIKNGCSETLVIVWVTPPTVGKTVGPRWLLSSTHTRFSSTHQDKLCPWLVSFGSVHVEHRNRTNWCHFSN